MLGTDLDLHFEETETSQVTEAAVVAVAVRNEPTEELAEARDAKDDESHFRDAASPTKHFSDEEAVMAAVAWEHDRATKNAMETIPLATRKVTVKFVNSSCGAMTCLEVDRAPVLSPFFKSLLVDFETRTMGTLR